MAYLGVPQSKLENLTTNVQIVNLSASFDGTTVTFNLQDSRGDAVYAVHNRALLVTLGGITQKPGVDYTTSGTTITFTTAPVSNLTIEIRKFYGVQRIIGVNDGVISPVKLTTGGPVWNSSGNVTISGDLNVTGSFNAGTNGLFWEDNERAKFGADNDLEIYHSGVNSFIRDSGTGSLFIEGTDLTLRAADSTTRYLEANASNGDVSLFFGNNKKFETTAQGISVTGDINGAGNFTLTSTNVGSTASPEINLFRNSTSPSDLDYLGQIKFTGKQDGGGTVNYAKITGKILDASDGTEDGILEFMLRKAGSDNIAARFRSDSFQLLNGTGLTVNGTTTLSGDLSLDDNIKAKFGTGDDLQIYHDGSHNRIKSLTGGLYIHVANGEFLSQNGSEVIAKFLQNAAVELYHNNSKKLETTTTGVKVTGALEVTQEYPTIRPTLDLNFAATKTLDRRITFRRGSIGTFTDDVGIVRYASNNVPRFDHDPTTGESLGLLIEESRTNDVAHSDPGNAVWLSDNGAVKTANTTDTKAPDGSFTALKLASQATGSSTSQLYDTFSKSSGGVQSIWAKKGTHNVLGIFDFQGSSGIRGWFDLNTGEHRCEGGSKVAAGVQSNGNDTNNTNMIEYPNGWYRCIYYESGNMTYAHFRIVDFDSDSEASSSSNTIYLWGAQAEVNKTFATSFIPSLSATMPATNSTRAQDTVKITGTNFTDFYNQEEGTLVAHYYSTVDDGYLAQLENSATPGDDRIGLVNYAGYQGFVETGNSGQASLDNGTPTVGAVNKVAFAFKTNDFAVSLNSATPVTDTIGTMPTVGRMMIGSRQGGAYDLLKSTIRHLSYYPKRLPNAQLQGLTQQ